MPTPIIGITAGRVFSPTQVYEHTLSDKYVTAVRRAGGLPVILPSGLENGQITELLATLDGVLLTGGGDIDPQLFNGIPHPRVYGIDEPRDIFELELVRQAAQTNLPFLGICRGVQVINVALGGSLFTDIGAQMPASERHDWFPDIPRDRISHVVSIQKGSRLAQLTSATQLEVNSLHHQGLDRIPDRLRVIARAADSLVEAVELCDHPFGLGVQWHPEWLVESPGNQAIFSGLVEAARDHK
ncbi:MAG: gamma-glutamyl-gamma-aminobutyrate hydrolase family protein [Bellilinea sp.]